MKEITLKQARNYALQQQFLSKSRLSGKEGTRAAIDQIGYVQIDTISVIERAHHHVLWTRVPNYKAEDLRKLEEEDRVVFEYWAHAASYLPISAYRYSLYRKEEIKGGKGHWHKRDSKNMKYVLDRFKAEGELMARDFKKGDYEGSELPWNSHPYNRAIRQLFMEGTIMITGRKGFQKKYDLPERILPNWVDQSMPTEREYFEYLIERDLKAHGLMKARGIGYLLKINRKRLRILLQELVEDSKLVELKIRGQEESYFSLYDSWNSFKSGKSTSKLHILSPFDNLIIQRKRLSELFEMEYLLECYVTAAKRKVGYFSLPLLYGTDFIGQVDLKADRKTKILWIRNLVWEERVKDREKYSKALSEKLDRFRVFNGCEEIRGEKGVDFQVLQ